MYSVSDQFAGARRARWLAELSEALDQALELVPGLMMIHFQRAELMLLHSRIDALRREVEALRMIGSENRSRSETEQFPRRA